MRMETEDEFVTGYCDCCYEYSDELTECPEDLENIKRNHWISQKHCTECCKELFDERVCHLSCEQKFIEKYLLNKFNEFCESKNFEKFSDNVYISSQSNFIISPNKFEAKYEIKPIFVGPPFSVGKYSIIPYKDTFYVYDKNDYETLYQILSEEFKETPRHLIQSENTTEDGKKALLKLEGDFTSGIIEPANLEPSLKEELRNQFLEYTKNVKTLIDIPSPVEKRNIVVSNREKDVVRIATVQMDFKLSSSFPFRVMDKTKTIKKIYKALEKANEYNVNIICFPELCFLEEWLPGIQEKYSNIMIIAGSYYNNRNNNICHLLFGANTPFPPQLKITPSAPEKNEYASRMVPGEYLNIYESKFGIFTVLICRDFPFYVPYLRDTVDIIFVPSYNKDLERFYSSAHCHVINHPSYVIIYNSSQFGGTSIFGIEDKSIFDQLVEANYKRKGDDTYNLCVIEKGDEGMIIADFNLTHKILPKPTSTDPENVIKPVKIVGKIDL
jgi:predicted amidohydrolase